ncbi:N-acetylmuramoyl-L-alanine amidase [Streptomyces sp. MBT42]|uniref:peptidoglycan recognition protein family protein n=1 Tax=Streptomyces sp. MBT42 TaxID=1488373 RepID=UPI001E404DB2|nr:N-acetylmuramoyl-L-alanine amidase [Streptomyces sp. MBT42]MCD2461988.1 N-acetylmuramoyl-L-alanine amidase [Streptomyces sp. MBT42]MCD2465551.1 N-acetylmuramoyl-L-alanine amidase [Streptomyces sp. MBT42]
MATPLPADRFLAALRDEGVTVVEHPGWRTHNRNHVGAWGPVAGVMIHHTVSTGTASSVEMCFNGYEGLPGPLCHGVIAKDGTVHLVGSGRANHAGAGDPSVLQAIITETYGERPPAPRFHQGSTGAVDGNSRFYGFECINLGDGKDPWPAEQLLAIERVSAALCRAHGWGARSVIGHLEWSDWKSDPKGFGMPTLRTRVQSRLAKDPAKPTTPAPTPPKENPVAPSKEGIALAVLTYREKRADEASKKAGRRIPDVYGYIVGTYTTVQGIAADLKKLVALLTAQKEK